ncbi:MAG: metalloregulator ArsR/SmtB family transcription factor [Saprospiraceae bacterium]
MRKNSHNRVVIDDEKLETSTEILRALAHPLRMRLLAFIDKHSTVNVNKIYNTLQLEQSITSQHLKILRETELVLPTRDGKYIVYQVNYDKLGAAIIAVRRFVETLEMDPELDLDD